MADDETRARMLAVLDALHRGRRTLDTAGVAELLTDDVVHEMPRSFEPEPVRGRDAVAHGLTAGVDRYFDPDTLRREIIRTTIEGNVAAVEQRLVCRTRDGQPYENDYVWVYEFRDGLICRLVEHADTLRAARQFGVA